MITGTVETIDTCFDVEILACRINDDYLLCRDIDENCLMPCESSLIWVNPDYVSIN